MAFSECLHWAAVNVHGAGHEALGNAARRSEASCLPFTLHSAGPIALAYVSSQREEDETSSARRLPAGAVHVLVGAGHAAPGNGKKWGAGPETRLRGPTELGRNAASLAPQLRGVK